MLGHNVVMNKNKTAPFFLCQIFGQNHVLPGPFLSRFNKLIVLLEQQKDLIKAVNCIHILL
jgi:hypothetical protein